MKKIGSTFLAILIIASGSYLARSQDTISPEKRALVKEYIEVSGGKQNFDEAIAGMLSYQRESSKQVLSTLSLEDDKASPADKARIAEMVNESNDRMITKFQEFMTKQFNYDKFTDDVFVPIYAKHFTDAELRDMITFYRSPTGQKFIKETPKLLVDVMSGFSEQLLPKLLELVKQVVDEESAVIRQKLTKNVTSD